MGTAFSVRVHCPARVFLQIKELVAALKERCVGVERPQAPADVIADGRHWELQGFSDEVFRRHVWFYLLRLVVVPAGALRRREVAKPCLKSTLLTRMVAPGQLVRWWS
jgi:N-dimethylarginine dimethylaminohydrolase